MIFGGRSNILGWDRREPGADSQNPAKPGRKILKTDKNRLNKKSAPMVRFVLFLPHVSF